MHTLTILQVFHCPWKQTHHIFTCVVLYVLSPLCRLPAGRSLLHVHSAGWRCGSLDPQYRRTTSAQSKVAAHCRHLLWGSRYVATEYEVCLVHWYTVSVLLCGERVRGCCYGVERERERKREREKERGCCYGVR